jgi:hypothetical protein
MGKIRLAEVWPKLVKLRELTLRNDLPNIAGVVTGAMKQIDMRRTAEVTRQQISDAPVEWRIAQALHADELEKEARLAEAKAIPFEKIMQKIKGNTSMLKLKVWCEGATDVPVFKEFLKQIGVQVGSNHVELDVIGGWPGLKVKDPERLRDGCREVIVIMDGDNGRKLGNPEKPLTHLGSELKKRLGKLGMRLYILERYGIENYFTRSACEAVLRMDLAMYFPIPIGRLARSTSSLTPQTPG